MVIFFYILHNKRTTLIGCFFGQFYSSSINHYGMIYKIKIEFLPSIEILRRVSNWSLYPIVENDIQHNKNPIFIHSLLEISKHQASDQDSLLQTKPKHCLIIWYHLLLLEQTKNTNPRYTNTHTKREGDKDLWASARCLHPKVEERDLFMIYKILQEDYNVLSRTYSILS